MKKKLKLNITQNIPEKFVGIASHFKDIQVVWSINKLTGLNFTKTDDIRIDIKERVFQFSMFRYFDEENNKHFFIANKNNETVLFQKFKTIDFLYVTNASPEQLRIFVNKISASKMISGSFILPADKTISKTFTKLFEE